MTETPGRPNEPTPEEPNEPTPKQTTDPATEPTAVEPTEPATEPTAVEPPGSTAEPTAEATSGQEPPAAEPIAEERPRATRPRSRWQWLDRSNRLNRVAALVAIVAGAVFVVAGAFGAGVMVGADSGEHHGGFQRSGHHSEMSADHGQVPIGRILIVPGGGGTQGPGGDGAPGGYRAFILGN
jgi:hypothetical protein